MSVRPVLGFTGNDTFKPSKDVMRSSVPHICSKTLMMPGSLDSCQSNQIDTTSTSETYVRIFQTKASWFTE